MDLNFLGAIFDSSGLGQYEYLATVVKFLDMAVVPITITLVVAAGIFSAILGFLIIKAESADKASELKKRLLGLIWTVLIITASIWLLGLILSNFNTIMTTIRSMGSGL